MILITAFRGNYNSSKILLDRIKSNNYNKLLLTNSFTTCEKEIVKAIIQQKPKYILTFGQKSNTDILYIETTGCRNGIILDTDFNVEALVQSLKAAKISYCLSNNAGNYLCNHVYYSGLDFLKQHSLDTKMIFIHVPSIKWLTQIDAISRWLNVYLETLE